MLIGACNIIKNSTARSSLHNHITHLYLQGVAFQIDRFLLYRQLSLLRRFIIRIVLNLRIGESGTNRQLDRVLFLCNSQTRNQLLVDLLIRLHASQNRHGIVYNGTRIVQRPWRIFLTIVVCPRLGKEFWQSVAQTAMVEYNLDDPGKTCIRSAHFLCQCIQSLSVIRSHVNELFQIISVFHLNQLYNSDDCIISSTHVGGREVNAHDII